MRIGWSASHGEFILSDHYYFSLLRAELRGRGVVAEDVANFGELEEYDVVVFNYPERPFTPEEAETVRKWAEGGKRVIFAGYYNNEDRVADVINSALRNVSLRINGDAVMDTASNHNGDPLFVVTSRVRGGGKVVMPCSASVSGGDPLVESESGIPLASAVSVGAGEVIVLGTCVFWDNYSITLYDNMEFSLKLLKVL